MQLGEYARYDGLGLGELVRTRQVSANELLDTARRGVEQVNGRLNFVAHDLFDFGAGLIEAGVPGGPFEGVPFGMKDLVADLAGTPLSGGSRLLTGNVSSQDSNLTKRFKLAGLIPVAKTTSSEFGCYMATESVRFGATRNPWNSDFTPGGSSGGSAAAVAAGVFPVGHASDGFGSIRVPASNCGIFGLKPTRQRTPTGPMFGELGGCRAIEFVVTRSVRDSAALLDCVHGADVGAPYHAPPAPRSYLDEIARPYQKLRIALLDHSFSGAAVDPACRDAALATAKACEALGHHVEIAAPAVDWPAFQNALRTEAMPFMTTIITTVAQAIGNTASAATLDRMGPMIISEGLRYSAQDYLIALEHYGRVQREVGAFFQKFDVLITPMLARPPAPIGWVVSAQDSVDEYWEKCCGDAYSPFAALFNVTGQPAASVPLFTSDDGLPIGTQIVGRFGDDHVMLNLSAQLEAAHPWAEHRPPIHVAAGQI